MYTCIYLYLYIFINYIIIYWSSFRRGLQTNLPKQPPRHLLVGLLKHFASSFQEWAQWRRRVRPCMESSRVASHRSNVPMDDMNDMTNWPNWTLRKTWANKYIYIYKCKKYTIYTNIYIKYTKYLKYIKYTKFINITKL